MNTKRSLLWLVGCTVVLFGCLITVSGEDAGGFRAGAAKVVITPPTDKGFTMSGYSGRMDPAKGAWDDLYLRALVVDDGKNQAAIVLGEISSIEDSFWQTTTQRIEKETGIPQANILLAATHTHSGPRLAFHVKNPSPELQTYTDELADNIIGIVKTAQKRLQPARMGVGTGSASININRRARLAGGAYWLGKNPDGPSDKTVHVLKFESTQGTPIAVLVNYGVHCTSLGSKNFKYSGDIGGATSRYLEEELGKGVVAIWTSGAAGDQAPLYNKLTSPEWVTAMGEILGEEVKEVQAALKMSSRMEIKGLQQVVTCPGKKLAGDGRFRAGDEYRIVDAEPVPIRLSLLLLDRVAIGGVSGEVLTLIGQRFKKESPFSNTMMVTNCNGSSGYLLDDEAYKLIAYETVSSDVKEGAEKAIVEGLLKLMDAM